MQRDAKGRGGGTGAGKGGGGGRGGMGGAAKAAPPAAPGAKAPAKKAPPKAKAAPPAHGSFGAQLDADLLNSEFATGQRPINWDDEVGFTNWARRPAYLRLCLLVYAAPSSRAELSRADSLLTTPLLVVI